MSIEPLSYETLDSAIALLHSVFNDEWPWDNPSFGPRLSLLSKRGGWKRWCANSLLDFCGIKTVEYWVIPNLAEHRVDGITGLYTKTKEPATAWLGWGAIRPECRKQGLGTLMYNHVTDIAREMNMKKVRVYTSTHPTEALARMKFDQHGFSTYKTRHILFTPYTMEYKELVL